MELRTEKNNVIFLIVGILFAWFALGTMFIGFQREEFTMEFDSVFMRYGWLILWFFCVVISSVFIGLWYQRKHE